MNGEKKVMKHTNYIMELLNKISLGYVLLIIAITLYGIAGAIKISVNNGEENSHRCEKLEKQIFEILHAGL
jgi:hypothetical protein